MILKKILTKNLSKNNIKLINHFKNTHWKYNIKKQYEWFDLNAGGISRFQITARAAHDAQEKLWKRVANHAYAGGFETGILSFEAAKKTCRAFKTMYLFSFSTTCFGIFLLIVSIL